MLKAGLMKLLAPSVAVLTVALGTGCGSAPADTAGQPAPPGAETVLARGDVLTRSQIEAIHAHTMVDLLDGRFPGVRVAQSASGPRLVIRGLADPLVVVDRVPLATADGIWSLNPLDIEEIRILKGNEAVVYGSRGGRGVVEITTRRF